MSFTDFLDRRSRFSIFIMGILLVALIGTIDYITGAEISFSVFYLMPISLMAWYVNGWAGAATAVVSAGVWFYADTLSGHTFSSPIIAFWNTLVRFGFYLIVVAALTNLKESFTVHQHLSRTDSLTGVVNTRYFYELAGHEMERARRYGHAFSVAYLDVDNFKLVNDQFGHQTGDALLSSMATLIRKNLRAPDIVARLGGDEFILMLPESDASAARPVLEKVRDLILELMRSRGWSATVSMGAVSYSVPPESVEDLITRSDNLMYAAKCAGKNRIEYADSQDDEKAASHHSCSPN